MKPFNLFYFFTADVALRQLTVPCFSFVPKVTSEARLKSVFCALSLLQEEPFSDRDSRWRDQKRVVPEEWGGWVKGIDHTLVAGGSSSTWLLRYIGIFTLDMTWCWIWEWRNSYHEETVNSRVSLPISFLHQLTVTVQTKTISWAEWCSSWTSTSPCLMTRCKNFTILSTSAKPLTLWKTHKSKLNW